MGHDPCPNRSRRNVSNYGAPTAPDLTVALDRYLRDGGGCDMDIGVN
jgi:hypothetical protein